MYRIHQIKLDINEGFDVIPGKIARKLGNKNLKITDVRVIKESIDARHKDNIKKVYSVDFNAAGSKTIKCDIAPDMEYRDVPSGQKPMNTKPVVIGFGPCGMFAALTLASRGYAPIVLERGNAIEQRVKDVEEFWRTGKLDTESNVQFGEGGAGTFSDGKLTTGIKDPRIRKVLEDFVDAGADSDILYKQKAHIGTDVLRTVVKNIRNRIIDLGGEIRFGSKMTELKVVDGQVAGLTYEDDGGTHSLETSDVIIAIGHSARDTFRYLHANGVEMAPKQFSIGVRIEHPQSLIDKAQYGKTKGLPPADYKLSHHCENGRGVYTFCMCPGGEVVCASSQEGGVVTNGMSNRARNSGTANSGLLVDVKVDDFDEGDALAGVRFQEKYEKLAFINGGSTYKIPQTTWAEFRDNKADAQSVVNSLPDFAVESIREAMPYLGRKLKGFDSDDAVMKAVESRSSSPVRFSRDENLEGSFRGFYPGGEGTGYAGGIMSAACDGIKIAEQIIKKYLPYDSE